jgi:hypothetical protein
MITSIAVFFVFRGIALLCALIRKSSDYVREMRAKIKGQKKEAPRKLLGGQDKQSRGSLKLLGGQDATVEAVAVA